MAYQTQYLDDKRVLSDMGGFVAVGEIGESLFHLLVPTTGMPATGAAPDQIETTVTTSRVRTYIAARQDTPQKVYPAWANRDNLLKLEKYKGKPYRYLQVNPDMVGYMFVGILTSYQTDFSTGDAIPIEITITVLSADDNPIYNVTSLLQQTTEFESEIPATLKLPSTTGTATFNLQMYPATGVSFTVENLDMHGEVDPDGGDIATGAVASGILTVTGVASGSTLLKINATATGYAPNFTTILVIVP
jgi:hypothetical protein